MKTLRIALRIIIGLVFIFSGFVKGIDPTGSAIKFSEYFEVFHISWLDQLSIFLAILQNTAEFLIGIALLVGLRMVVTAWATLVFMVFYTILTLYIAIANPVSDCGCFGDALVLTNWETFYKNIVLMALTIPVFMMRKAYIPYSKPIKEWVLVGLFAGGMTFLSVYCYNHLPIIDFMPYHVGAHIPSQMTVPEDAPKEISETTLLYEKNGVVEEFTLENYPADDTTWVFKDSKYKVIKEGYKPPIHGFSITKENGEDITDQVLSESSYSFWIISPDLHKIKESDWGKIKQVNEYCNKNGIHFYFLNGSPQSYVDEFKVKYKLSFPFYFTDVTALKTIVRSNPGLILAKEGIVLAKWHSNDIPVFGGREPLLSQILTSDFRSIEGKRIWMLVFGLAIILITLWFLKKKN